MLKFDLVLVFSAVQRNCIFLDIIQKLSSTCRILVYILPLTKNQNTRLAKTSKLFLFKCEELGAEVFSGTDIECDIMILAQRNYRQQEIQKLASSINAQKTLWLTGVAMGNAQYENLFGLKIDQVLVPDMNFYRHRLSKFSNDGVEFPRETLIEIGMPKYSVFENCFKAKKINYMVAHPTPFSFSSTSEAYIYYKRLYELTCKLTRDGKLVVIKNHNADERGNYLVTSRSITLARLISYFRLEKYFLAFVNWHYEMFLNKSEMLSDLLLKMAIGIIDLKILRNCPRLSDFTNYADLNLELFLPYVQNGLITGRSNSIWHALHQKLPVINLIEAEIPYKYESKMHKYAMEYFGVHFSGEFEFNISRNHVISNTTRNANFASVIKCMLDGD